MKKGTGKMDHMHKTVLAFDIGASNGRAILGRIEKDQLLIQEVHRFSNDPAQVGDTLYWDILRIFYEIKSAVKKALEAAPDRRIDSIGIDTWGVDFGFIDQYGNLTSNPVHYRDARTNGALAEIEKRISKKALYGQTGTQFMFSNTLYQLIGLQKQGFHFPRNTGTLLMIPDLLIYFLTGNIACEITNASTTQLFSPERNTWCYNIMEQLSIPRNLFAEPVSPGTFRGNIRPQICSEMNIPAIPVYTVAEHDTASAVAAIPYMQAPEESAYISCGTASILGTECPKPYLSGTAYENNFTNEIGYGGTIRLAKNIAGMWLLQESRRQWAKEGKSYTFGELSGQAEAAKPVQCVFDPDDPRFIAPGDLPGRIRRFCRETHQQIPESIGETVRCIYKSLAQKHAARFKTLTEITGISYKTLHLIGGGSKDPLFSRILASACGCRVIAGPYEAAAIGNCIVQLITLGALKNLQQARELISRSVTIRTYTPEQKEPQS